MMNRSHDQVSVRLSRAPFLIAQDGETDHRDNELVLIQDPMLQSMVQHNIMKTDSSLDDPLVSLPKQSPNDRSLQDPFRLVSGPLVPPRTHRMRTSRKPTITSSPNCGNYYGKYEQEHEKVVKLERALASA